MKKLSFHARIKREGDELLVRMIIEHPMISGQPNAFSTAPILPHFIQEVECNYQGKNIFLSTFGPSISKNPYLAFRLKSIDAGEEIQLHWLDNRGNVDDLKLIVP